jgi:AbrB family looped-hinge helix DNA binding protein
MQISVVSSACVGLICNVEPLRIRGTLSDMDHFESYATTLGDRGRLVLPSKLRQRLGLHPGDRLVITVDEEGGFRVISAREVARRTWGLYRDLAPGRSLADELIAERREEARREDAQ